MIYDSGLSHRQSYYRDICHPNEDIINKPHPDNGKDIIIGNDVYIGVGVKLRRGIKIGNGAIVGAYSVVTKDVAPYSVVAGSPAKEVRRRYNDKQIEKLEEMSWWDYDFRTILHKTHNSDIGLFIDRLQYLIDAREVNKFTPTRHYIREMLA